jgi:hypothetical protein
MIGDTRRAVSFERPGARAHCRWMVPWIVAVAAGHAGLAAAQGPDAAAAAAIALFRARATGPAPPPAESGPVARDVARATAPVEGVATLQLPPMPAEDVRQYLRSFGEVKLDVELLVDDDDDGGEAALGPLRVPDGTRIQVSAGFHRAHEAGEATLSTLSVVPTRPVTLLGPLLAFDRLVLDERGRLRFEARILGLPDGVIVEGIYRDADDNLVFNTEGRGLVGGLAPDMRVTPRGRVQIYQRGFLWLGLECLGASWVDVVINGAPVEAGAIPIRRWPIRLADLADWMPAPGTPPPPSPAAASGTAAAPAPSEVIDAIPVKDVAVRFVARSTPSVVALGDGVVSFALDEHGIEVDLHGRFEGRTFRTDPSRANAARVVLQATGRVEAPGVRVSIGQTRLDASATLEARVPFERLEEATIRVDWRAGGQGKLGDVSLALPGAPQVSLTGESTLRVGTGGLITIRPGATDDLAVSIDMRPRADDFALRIAGPMVIAEPGRVAPMIRSTRITLAAPSPEIPLVTLEGLVGFAADHLVFDLRPSLDVDVLEPVELLAEQFRGRAIAHTRLTVGGELTAAFRKSAKPAAMAGGAALEVALSKILLDSRLQLTPADVSVDAPGLAVRFPGATAIALEAAAHVVLPAAPAEMLDNARVKLTVTRPDAAEATLDVDTPDGMRVSLGLRQGSRLHIDTGAWAREPGAAPAAWNTQETGRIEAALGFSQMHAEGDQLDLTVEGPASATLAATPRGRVTTAELDHLGITFDVVGLLDPRSSLRLEIPSGLNVVDGPVRAEVRSRARLVSARRLEPAGWSIVRLGEALRLEIAHARVQATMGR